MMKFKDEQGNFVTPRKGDYVLASDIKDDEMHNRVREAFAMVGCCLKDPYGRYGNSNTAVLWDAYGDFSWSTDNSGSCKRRIIPHQQQTLLEAACEAEDDTRFKLGSGFECWVKDGTIIVDGFECGKPAILLSTDFEQLPSGPKKRDVPVTILRLIGTLSIEVPDDAVDECVNAFDLIGRLMQWEGAQIGKAGYSIGELRYETDNPLPYVVTFKTAEQCEAAWKAECPEMFE